MSEFDHACLPGLATHYIRRTYHKSFHVLACGVTGVPAERMHHEADRKVVTCLRCRRSKAFKESA